MATTVPALVRDTNADFVPFNRAGRGAEMTRASHTLTERGVHA